MSPLIDIEQEVWEALQARAEPLIDTPNSVLRRVLGLARESDDHPAPKQSVIASSRISRAPVGSLLPESAYELPILRVLADNGGSAPARDVVHAVGELMADQLTELDRETLPNGGERWQSRVQFGRLRMKEKGLIKSGSPRGLWELSDLGIAALQEESAAG